MKTKFIVGTNKQYSIREDGEVVRHYKLTWTGNITQVKDVLMTKYGAKNAKYIIRVIDGINKSLSINTLLFDYFGFKYCKTCGNKMYNKVNIHCDKCHKETRRRYNQKTSKKKQAWAKKNGVDVISRNYVAPLLGLKMEDLTDEIYYNYKELLAFKRQVAQTHNISINSLK